MIIDYKEQNSSQRYNLMASSVIPRPIAWISTTNENGSLNLAPFSYFTPLSSDPATLLVSIGHKTNGELKDTLKNIKETKKCTICVASPEFLEPLHFSANSYEYNESEVEKLNIEMETIDKEYPAMVKGVPVAFLCDFHSLVELDGKTIPTILEIKKQYINNEVIQEEEGKQSINFEPLARVARDYGIINQKVKAPKK